MNIIRLSISGLLAALLSLPLNADDTEIFRQPPQVTSPNILIVFDDSGSMSTKVSNQRIKFSEFTLPNSNTESVSSTSYSSDYLYFSLSGESAPSADEENRRLELSDKCSALDSLSGASTVTLDSVTYGQDGSPILMSQYTWENRDRGSINCNSPGWWWFWSPKSKEVTFYTAGYLNNQYETAVSNTASDPYLYWSVDGTVPNWNSSQKFPANLNRCASSIDALYGEYKVGLFSTIGLAGFGASVNEQQKAWRGLGELDLSTLEYVDCTNDYVNDTTTWTDATSSAFAGDVGGSGYPVQGSETAYVDDEIDPPAAFSGAVTLYSQDFVYWYHQNTSKTNDYSRLQIAQDVVNTLVRSRDGDFGLALLNYQEGGRIVRPIGPKSSDASLNVETLIMDNDVMRANGWTPLCETHYEIYQYLTGGEPVYANKTIDNTGKQTAPAKGFDSAGYSKPAATCDEDVYIIYLTDGEPRDDSSADKAINELLGLSGDKECAFEVGTDGCWSELAGHMADPDNKLTEENGYSKRAYTYAIGFVDSTNSTTLRNVFEPVTQAGKGRYYSASSYLEIFNAFQAIYNDIVDRDSTFTSPSVAVNSFKRTESLNDVFFQMFTPSSGESDWKGNLKKLQIKTDNDGCTYLASQDTDQNCNNSAFLNGSIKKEANTFWKSGLNDADGDLVEEGGFGQILVDRGAKDRVFYTNAISGTDEVLCDINKPGETCGNSIIGSSTTFGPSVPRGLFDLDGFSDDADFQRLMNYVRGYNVGDVAEHWMVGDAIHARAVVVNYGMPGCVEGNDCKFSADMPDTRVLFATNRGVLHFINNRSPEDYPTPHSSSLSQYDGDYDGKEAWAFFPAELIETAAQRYLNEATTEPVYGLDATPAIYTLDNNNDGTLDWRDDDKVYALISMRRGGRMIYALDISDPDAPKFLWKVKGGNVAGELAELGQTWSVPQVAKIPGYSDDGNPKPVLILGAGYDEGKDTQGVSAGKNADSMGRGLYILDMETGSVVWSLTHNGRDGIGGNQTDDRAENELNHSVPATVTTVDSNGDGKIDRVYWPDTGGQIWRLDMPWSDSLGKNWSWHKVASLNGSVNGKNEVDADTSDDRRFFNQIDFVPSTGPVSVCEEYASTTPTWGVCATDSGYTTLDMGYDALLIGSGDRTNPLATDVQNRFYMIRDLGISTYEMALDLDTCDFTKAVDAVNFDFRCLGTLTDEELEDLTLKDLSLTIEGASDSDSDIVVQPDGTTVTVEAVESTLREKAGWLIDLQGVGEKALSASVSLKGTVFFTTFSLEKSEEDEEEGVTENVCAAPTNIGEGRLYMVDLHDARGRLINEANEDEEASGSRFRTLGSVLPDTPSIHVGEEGDMNLIFPSGGDDDDNIENSNVSLPAPQGVYWYQSLEVN